MSLIKKEAESHIDHSMIQLFGAKKSASQKHKFVRKALPLVTDVFVDMSGYLGPGKPLELGAPPVVQCIFTGTLLGSGVLQAACRCTGHRTFSLRFCRAASSHSEVPSEFGLKCE